MRIPIAKPYLDVMEERAVAEVLRSGWVSQGPKCLEFENAVASFVGVRHARAVNSGTGALHLTLLACGIRSGDEVIVPAFTCVATLNPLESIGAKPVLADVSSRTFALEAEGVRGALTPRTKAIIVVHLFGLPASIEPIVSLAGERGVLVIEDAALSLGASINGRAVGTFGSAAFLSFHPRKMITTGEGGMVLTGSAEIADGVGPPRALEGSRHVYQAYTALLPAKAAARRAEIIGRLKSLGIETTIGTYHMPLTTYFRTTRGFHSGDFPRTDDVASRAISLPLYEAITEKEQEQVVAALTREAEEAWHVS